MNAPLMRYEAARYALQIAEQVDEVKDIRDKAQALAAYARQAKDQDLIKWATDIKLRAERRAGEMLAAVELSQGGRPSKTTNIMLAVSDNTVKTLEEIGLSYKQSSDFQAIAAIPEDKFEKLVEAGKTSTAALVKASPKTKAAAKAAKAKAGPFAAALEESTEKQAAAARAPKEKPAKVNKAADQLTQLQAEHKELKEHCEDLTDELKTSVALMGTEPAIEMQKLREQLRVCIRRRDELMAQAVEMRGQINFWKKQAEKLGWKPEVKGA